MSLNRAVLNTSPSDTCKDRPPADEGVFTAGGRPTGTEHGLRPGQRGGRQPAYIHPFPRLRDLPKWVRTSEQDHPNLVGCIATPRPPGSSPADGPSGLSSAPPGRPPVLRRNSLVNAPAVMPRASAGGRTRIGRPTSTTFSSSPTPSVSRSPIWSGDPPQCRGRNCGGPPRPPRSGGTSTAGFIPLPAARAGGVGLGGWPFAQFGVEGDRPASTRRRVLRSRHGLLADSDRLSAAFAHHRRASRRDRDHTRRSRAASGHALLVSALQSGHTSQWFASAR